MADRLLLDPDGISAVMSLESGYNPQAVNQLCMKEKGNADQCATGLIQFMPETARHLGTSVHDLRGMSAVEQLVFVERFYRPFAGKLKTPGDYYMATFMPAHVGKPASTVLFVKGSAGYRQNAGLDRDQNGQITVGDVTRVIDQRFAEAKTKPTIEVDVTIPLGGPGSGLSPPSSGSSAALSGLSGHVTELPVIRPGMRGPAVRLWRALLRLGPGDYDEELETETEAFQDRQKIKKDRIVGPKTWDAMISSLRG
jgi:hypothetical protein